VRKKKTKDFKGTEVGNPIEDGPGGMDAKKKALKELMKKNKRG